jgi:diketogulonate reductase-like aldo/keto reductase
MLFPPFDAGEVICTIRGYRSSRHGTGDTPVPLWIVNLGRTVAGTRPDGVGNGDAICGHSRYPDPAIGVEETLTAFGELIQAGKIGHFGLSNFAFECGTSVSTLALAWVLADPVVTAIVVGPRQPAQLRPAIDAVDFALTAAQRAELAEFIP